MAVLATACARDMVALWPIVGTSMVRHYGMRILLAGHLDALRADVILDWVDDDIEAARAVARAATVAGDHPPTVGLLERHGDDPGVAGTLAAVHGSGSYSGGYADWLRVKLAELERWSHSSVRAVRTWATARALESRGTTAEVERLGIGLDG